MLTYVIGFTGTRRGMTPEQKEAVRRYLLEVYPTEVSHGDRVGSDAEFHDLVREILPACKIVIRPGPDEELRAFKQGDVLLPVKTHYARNRDIVDNATAVLVVSACSSPQPKGATRYAINYAIKKNVAVDVIYPTGEMKIYDACP